jgi:hypothetical protein
MYLKILEYIDSLQYLPCREALSLEELANLTHISGATWFGRNKENGDLLLLDAERTATSATCALFAAL